MKTLVVYYSRTGNTRKIGNEIAAALGAEIEELKDDVSRDGPVGFVRSAREARSGKLVNLDPLSHDPSTCDIVVVGTPVWAGNVSSPIRTFLRNSNLGNAKAAWFCTIASGSQSQQSSCFRAMTDETGQTPVATIGFSANDLKGDHSQAIAQLVAMLNVRGPQA